MGLKHHQIRLKNLRENEEVLHNCSSHVLIHLKPHLLYLIGILLPLVGLILLDQAGFFKEESLIFWFLYTCYGLILTTCFFVRGVNFELGGCVITNQRLLLFGYQGLMQIVEREILPNKIEDFKIEKKGLFSVIFNTAYIYIHTSNQQIKVLRHVIQPEKVQDAYAKMVRSHSGAHHSPSTDPIQESAWIDDALKDSAKDPLNMEHHRQGMIGNIGKVFKRK